MEIPYTVRLALVIYDLLDTEKKKWFLDDIEKLKRGEDLVSPDEKQSKP